MLITSLGILTLFYDRILGIKDSNFHPDQIIFSRRSESVADPHILTTHAHTTRIPDISRALLEKEKVAVGTRLTDFHMSATKRALPHSDCFTYTEYLRENREVAFKILEEVIRLKPSCGLVG